MRTLRNALIGLLAALLVVGCAAWAFTSGPLRGFNPFTPSLAEDFTIAPGAIPDEFQCKDSVASLANAHGPFKFSDSISSALNEQKDAPKAAKELDVATCTEVLTGYAQAQALASPEAKIDADTTLLQKNAWLGDFIARGQSASNLAKVFMTYDKAAGRWETTEEYRMYASAINYLRSKFNTVSIEDGRVSIANWYVQGRDRFTVDPKNLLVPLSVRNTEYQENRLAIWFTAIDKNDTCHLVIGVNLGDKRPEIGSCPAPAPTTAPTSSNGGGSSTSTTTTSNGGSTTSTSTTTTTAPPSTSTTTRPPTSTTTTTTPPKTCPAGYTGTYPNCIAPKTGSNPGLSSNQSGQSVSTDNGATDSKGVQSDPAADAAAAKAAADAAAAAKAAAAASAAAQASTDSGGGTAPHSSAPAPTSSSTGSAGEDTSGCIWGPGNC